MGQLVPYAKVANETWSIWQDGDGKYTNEQVDHVLLMDIRQSLRMLLAIFQCDNAQQIPHFLRQIQANTTPKRRAIKRRKR